jgi:hypothetical protein
MDSLDLKILSRDFWTSTKISFFTNELNKTIFVQSHIDQLWRPHIVRRTDSFKLFQMSLDQVPNRWAQ